MLADFYMIRKVVVTTHIYGLLTAKGGKPDPGFSKLIFMIKVAACRHAIIYKGIVSGRIRINMDCTSIDGFKCQLNKLMNYVLTLRCLLETLSTSTMIFIQIFTIVGYLPTCDRAV